MAHPSGTAPMDKQSGVVVNSKPSCDGPGGSSGTKSLALTAASEPPCTSGEHIHSIDHLKQFMSFLCDKQAIDLATAIQTSVNVFEYCIPAREAVLTFYSDLFSEYNTHYWVMKKRSLPSANIASDKNQQQQQQQHQGRTSIIDYSGELTRRFLEMEKLKMADAREDRLLEAHGASPMALIPSASSPKSVSSHLTGPDSPTASGSHTSPNGSPTKPIITRTRKIPTSSRTSSCNSVDEEDQTPMSPTQDSDANAGDNMQCDEAMESLDIFQEIERRLSRIRQTFDTLIERYKLKHKLDLTKGESTASKPWPPNSFSRQRERLRDTLTQWAAELLLQSNSKYIEMSMLIASDQNKGNPAVVLAKLIDLWVQNPVSKLMIDLILDCRYDVRQLFDRLIKANQNCDWLLAYTLLELSKRPEHDDIFTSCMEYIIGGPCNTSSLTFILAYLSDNNPRAMTNFPKSNIPLLISQCQASRSLLDVLALELPDEINVNFLNNLAKEIVQKIPSQSHSIIIDGIKHCIMAAPNSYKLFLLALDVMLNENISSEVKAAAQVIIDKILERIQQRTMAGIPISTIIISNPEVQIVDGMLNQINSDPNKLILKSASSKFVRKKASKVLHLMSLLYGNQFASRIIAHHLSLPRDRSWPLLKPLMDRFMKNFGDDGTTLASQTLALDASFKTGEYWENLYNLTVTMPSVKLDLDIISQLLADKLCATILDVRSTARLIRLCRSSLERVDHARIRISTKHKLCRSLATCFFLLLDTSNVDFHEILSHIQISLTCMNLLAQTPIASHIICRALLERCLVYGHLFNASFNPSLIGTRLESSELTQDQAIRLAQENLKVSLGHRFRRLPNYRIERESMNNGSVNKSNCHNGYSTGANSDKPDRHSINSYLLIEAFKSSINNIEAFSNLFVEFHCPVMFDKNSWPSDEALRVINEKNLSILRRFEQVPPFWDLFELIGQKKCLGNCLVLVKALLAAHLAMWASATAKSCPDKMVPTTRLIPPLAQSDLVPRAFALTVEVFPHLSPSEVFSVLSDIWQYLKDTNMHQSDTDDLPPEEQRQRTKNYLNRLRLFMCQHMPGSTYVKIFKEFYQPAPKTIPT